MPRKSLPASQSTPLRSTSSAPARATSLKRVHPGPLHPTPSTSRLILEPTRSSSREKRRPARIRTPPPEPEPEPEPRPPVLPETAASSIPPPQAEEVDHEKELEAWQDFAAEHYEMVEQLPLELHRNFRLLRELDDGSRPQTEALHTLMRDYIAQRLALVSSTSPDAASEDVDMAESHAVDLSLPAIPPSDETAPLPDGEGGLVLPPPTTDLPSEPRNDFPPRSPSTSFPGNAIASSSRLASAKPIARPGDLLPEIARLARELVRNGEEKVAVAVGAYNSIDRHIRALDSALSAHETSLLLGLRPATLPSTTIENALDPGAAVEEPKEEENGEIIIGMGGGVARSGTKKGRRDRQRKKVVSAAEDVRTLPRAWAADPNEPTYCFCNDVSYDSMIGCSNDDCEVEWYHLACVGLKVAPKGDWYCDNCRVKPAGGSVPSGRRKR
ncbi:hypothetical protein P7C73_g5037, partial [Tremellales sp. Uapishka_1]